MEKRIFRLVLLAAIVSYLMGAVMGATVGYTLGNAKSEFTPGPNQVGLTYCDGNVPRTFIDGRVFEDADSLLATEVIVHEAVHRAQLSVDCKGTMEFAANNVRARLFFEAGAYCQGMLAVSQPGTGDYARRRALAVEALKAEVSGGFTPGTADAVLTKVGCQ